MTSDRLLVCSVFGGGELDAFWLKLQLSQLRETAGAFTHAVFLGQRAEASLFTDSVVVGRASVGVHSEHYEGLVALGQYCREHPHSGYLILDSDAFPIKPGWEEILKDHLRRLNKDYAAVIRTENLDTFPHPCVMYSTNPKWLQFRYTKAGNLLGGFTADLSCAHPNFLPMMKTNRRSPHPVLASVYYDLFYHHGCGSREFKMRSIKLGYYSHIAAQSAAPEDLLAELQGDPRRLIAHVSSIEPQAEQVPCLSMSTRS